jgi:hypothetical protein
MDKNDHFRLMRLQSAELKGRTAFCPEDQEIAEYFDAQLSATEIDKLERHLKACRFCLARIGMLERLVQVKTNKRIPEAVLATAKRMTHQAPARRFKTPPAWATAAVLAIALLISINTNEQATAPGAIPPAAVLIEEDSRQLRGITRDVTSLDVLSPTAGASIKPGTLIHWSEVPGKLHYNIFILSSTGDVLWTERLSGNDWLLNDSLQLEAGSQYYIRVDAQLPDGRNLSSRHVVFHIARQP